MDTLTVGERALNLKLSIQLLKIFLQVGDEQPAHPPWGLLLFALIWCLLEVTASFPLAPVHNWIIPQAGVLNMPADCR